jgi:hypothetical protein
LKKSNSKSNDNDTREFEYHSRSVSPQEYYEMNPQSDSVFHKTSQESKKKNSDYSNGAFIVAPDGDRIRLGQKLTLSNR